MGRQGSFLAAYMGSKTPLGGSLPMCCCLHGAVHGGRIGVAKNVLVDVENVSRRDTMTATHLHKHMPMEVGDSVDNCGSDRRRFLQLSIIMGEYDCAWHRETIGRSLRGRGFLGRQQKMPATWVAIGVSHSCLVCESLWCMLVCTFRMYCAQRAQQTMAVKNRWKTLSFPLGCQAGLVLHCAEEVAGPRTRCVCPGCVCMCHVHGTCTVHATRAHSALNCMGNKFSLGA